MLAVTLAVRGLKCLVVGGGGVALRKVETLLGEGAAVTVVAPEPLSPLTRLASRGEIVLHRRPYRDGEAADFRLVFAATDDTEVNARVHRDADRAKVWVNVADDPERCSFHLPAKVRRGVLQICIATDGKAPFVSRRLRQHLEKLFGPEWAEWIRAATRFRERVQAKRLPAVEAESCFSTFFSSTVDPECTRARVPTEGEMEVWADSGRSGTAQAEPIVSSTPEPRARECGFVSLVGAGPGDPLLLTLRGAACLRNADVVVYDRLAARALPAELPTGVELRCVGKEPGHHPLPQGEINELLVRLARTGKRIVRFKGGDPFVFGRGGEEAEALRAAGIPFEVVPGVTSGIAAAAHAGIPVTHRKEAVRLTLLTAHECDAGTSGEGGSRVRWDLLAQDENATLIGYMGVTSLPRVTQRLLAAKMNPATPAAVIEWGTTAAQRQVFAPLSELAEVAARAGIVPPAIFAIGPTVRHGIDLDWRKARPLSGERLALVAPGLELGEALTRAGCELVEVPLPLTPAAQVRLGAAPVTGWLLRRPEEVDALEEERGRPEWAGDPAVWCLGDDVVLRAKGRGWPGVQSLPAGTDPPAIVRAIALWRHAQAR